MAYCYTVQNYLSSFFSNLPRLSHCFLMMIHKCVCIGSTSVENLMIPASVWIGRTRVESVSSISSVPLTGWKIVHPFFRKKRRGCFCASSFPYMMIECDIKMIKIKIFLAVCIIQSKKSWWIGYLVHKIYFLALVCLNQKCVLYTRILSRSSGGEVVLSEAIQGWNISQWYFSCLLCRH